MSCASSLPKRPDAAIPAHMRGIRCYEPRMRLLVGIESAALARAADGRVLDPLKLANQRDVDGCVDACFMWRAAIYDAFRSGQSIGLASNGQSKCFDRFQFGVQLLQLRLFYQPTGSADSPLLRFHRECMRSASARFVSLTRLNLVPVSPLTAVPPKERKVDVTVRTNMLKVCCAPPHVLTDRPLTTAIRHWSRHQLGSIPCQRWSMPTTTWWSLVITSTLTRTSPRNATRFSLRGRPFRTPWNLSAKLLSTRRAGSQRCMLVELFRVRTPTQPASLSPTRRWRAP